jgi:hypothetical protein
VVVLQTAMASMEHDEAEQNAEDTPMWVKYNRLLHGRSAVNAPLHHVHLHVASTEPQ